jgi:AraC-like DNA-binding protein
MSNSLLSGENLFAENEKIYVHKSTSLPEYVDKMHYHDYLEITYVTMGECDHYEGDEEFRARNGDLFIINPGTQHANYRVCDYKNKFVAYDIAFTLDFLDPALKGKTQFFNLADSYLFKASVSQNDLSFLRVHLKNKGFYEIEYLFAQILEEYTEKRPGYYDIIRTQLIELILRIIRKIEMETLESNKKETQGKYIKNAIQYIETHYKERMFVKDVASLAYCSKSHFAKAFKDSTGMSFSDYLQKIRIEHACEMLCNTDMTIADIAEQTGFNDIKFFYVVFKKITQVTPMEYRNHKTRRNPKLGL